jgi:Asp-tRNA(Asn)/Glu-tRNA(Gln) amidotransferase C subunit
MLQAALEQHGIPPSATSDGNELTEVDLRADEVTEGGCAVDVLANASRRDGEFFSVPKFVQS